MPVINYKVKHSYKMKADIELTETSAKGLVVIPARIRRILKIKPGTRFTAYCKEGMVMLKKIVIPTLGEFEKITSETGKTTKERDITDKDIEEAIIEVRHQKI